VVEQKEIFQNYTNTQKKEKLSIKQAKSLDAIDMASK
jgi:hypothetical protein